MALALLTLCSLPLLATGCKRPEVVAVPIQPPSERIQCAAAGDRPGMPPEYAIDWANVATVDQAKAEHLKYVASVRSREGVIVGYIMRIEGRLFACSTNAEWLRDFFAGMPDDATLSR